MPSSPSLVLYLHDGDVAGEIGRDLVHVTLPAVTFRIPTLAAGVPGDERNGGGEENGGCERDDVEL